MKRCAPGLALETEGKGTRKLLYLIQIPYILDLVPGGALISNFSLSLKAHE